MKMNKQLTKKLAELAQNENFYGKRKQSSKLAVVESVTEKWAEFTQLEGEALDAAVQRCVDWLEKNKPSRGVASSIKPPADTLEPGRSHTVVNCELANHPGYIVTSAQNNTEICKEFWEALNVYARALEYTILVSGFSYNKSGYQTYRAEGDNTDIMYSEELRPHLINEPVMLYDNLIFAAELDILPTTARPTNGRSNYHGDCSLIIPHVKIELQSYPTAQQDHPKFVYATGTVTERNYIKSNAGQKAEAEHAIAALVVVPHPDTATGWQVRQLHWDGYAFIDLEALIAPGGIFDAPPATNVSAGDLHSEKMDWASLGRVCELAERLKAQSFNCHDTLDFTTRNHHNRDNHHFIAAQGGDSIASDLERAGRVLNRISKIPSLEAINIVRSNHDEALDRWLVDSRYDFRDDPVNARLYLDLQSAAYKYIEEGNKVPEMFKIAMDVAGVEYPNKCRFLTRQDKLEYQGVIHNMHGDTGNNGSRATPTQLARTYNKTTTGHTHSCAIFSGAYVAGVTGSLDQGYNTANGGGSSWSQSHVVQYGNGTRAVITY